MAKIEAVLVGLLLLSLALSFALNPHHRRSLIRRVVTGLSVYFSHTSAPKRLATFPKVIFWAWERPEDLRFLGGKNAGVAFLAKTIYVFSYDEDPHKETGDTVFIRPRLQPLHVAPSTPLIAVIRIETRAGRHPQPLLSNSSNAISSPLYAQRQETGVVNQITELANLPNVRAIQIDFDATLSERSFYVNVLKHVRQKLPANFPLSITALASWCIGDRWLDQLPPGTIDEAVPMLFRMGPDTANVSQFFHSRDEFPVSACQNSLGVSTDEPFSQSILNGSLSAPSIADHDKRIYIFSPQVWTESAAESVLEEWQP